MKKERSGRYLISLCLTSSLFLFVCKEFWIIILIILLIIYILGKSKHHIVVHFFCLLKRINTRLNILLNLVKIHKILIAITHIWLIWHQMEFRLVPNWSEKYDCNKNFGLLQQSSENDSSGRTMWTVTCKVKLVKTYIYIYIYT